MSDGKYHEQVRISEDATGYSYESLFKPYITSAFTEVWVEDPYIRHTHQVKASFLLLFNFEGFIPLFTLEKEILYLNTEQPCWLIPRS